MVELRIVISDPKTGKSVQRIVKEESIKPFFGLRLGDKVRGELLDLTGYEFKLTGGSDDAGFPMRRDVQGTAKKLILTTGPTVGVKKNPGRGQRIRKTVSGNTVGAQTAQLNLKIEKAGKEDIFPKPETKTEEKPAETKSEKKGEKTEEKKEEPAAPKEETREEKKKEEKPAKEKKEEPKQ